MQTFSRTLLSVLLLALPAVVQAQWQYTVNNGTITITGYTGSGGAVTIPDTINGLPVTDIAAYAFEYSGLTSVTMGTNLLHIGDSAFYTCTALRSITISDSVVSIGSYAFYSGFNLATVTIGRSVSSLGNAAFEGCINLTGIYFKGNAPSLGGAEVFSGANNATVYYLLGTSGWGATYGGRPTAVWNSQIQASGLSFGVRTNRFGFMLTGTIDIPVVVEACTDLASASWTVLQGCTITNGSIYFSDRWWTNYPARFYRVRSP